MKKTLKHLLSLLLVASMLCSLFPAYLVVTAEGTEEEEDSFVVIDDPLTSEASLSRFRGFSCTPALKVIDDKPVGVTMGNYDNGLGWPYMVFGESDWADYILEFTTHDLTRVGGIVRSIDAIKNNDGYGGIMAMCDGSLTAFYQKPGENKSVSMKASGSFTATTEMRFRIAVSGTSLSAEVTTDPNGASPATYSVTVDDTSASGKTHGKLGFRSVFRDINGENHEGYFSDLKVTLTGDTAKQYKNTAVAIDDALTSSESLSLFRTYGCSVALKENGSGDPVGVKMVASSGWPFVTFGESDWKDYILEFTAHDLFRIGGIVRSTGAVTDNNGYGGISVTHEDYNSSTTLQTLYSENKQSISLLSSVYFPLAHENEIHFRIAISGSTMTFDMTYTENGSTTVKSKTILADTTASGKVMGKPGIRSVWSQFEGTASNGYISDLKVTLLGDTAAQYEREQYAMSHSAVAIDDTLTNEASLSLFQGFSCTPAIKEIDDTPVGMTMNVTANPIGYPYLLFGDADWEDYILEFTAHDMDRVGGIVRSTGAVNHIDGYGGILATYENYNNAKTFKALYSNSNTSTTLSTGDPASLVFEPQNEFRFRITVIGTTMTCDITYPSGDSTVTKSILVDTTISAKTAGKPGLRAVYNQVNGEKASGYFSDLKVTLLGDAAVQYNREHPDVTHVALEDPLTSASALDFFEGYGCEPALKIINGEPVGITMGGATSAMGYPYLLFGESDWEDYILEFTAHGMTRVGGIVRSSNGIENIDGYGGISAAFETNNLRAIHSVKDTATNKYSSPQIKTGDPYTVPLAAADEMRFRVMVAGNKMTCDVSYLSGGETVTKSIRVDISDTGKEVGKPGLRAVYMQVNGQEAEGYFSDLKVTLLGDTATLHHWIDQKQNQAGDTSLKENATCTTDAVYYKVCDICDRISATETWSDTGTAAHSFASEWTTDAIGHWHVCTADGCDIEDYATCGLDGAAYGEHSFDEYGVCICGLTQIDIPTAVGTLIYTGETVTGVPEGTGYTLEGNTATDVGTYTATVTLEEGYIWSDGTTEDKTIEWEIISRERYNLITGTCDSYEGMGGRMARQGKINDGVVSTTEGRTIIPLTQEQLDSIDNTVYIVASDGHQEFEVTLDCAYSYFYNVENGTPVKYEAKDMNYAAFLIIDNNGKDGTITGYGYYRLYRDEAIEDEDHFMFDALYTDPASIAD